MRVKTNVIPFARYTGGDLIKKPYIHHNNTPVLNTIYIGKEISFVLFVFIV